MQFKCEQNKYWVHYIADTIHMMTLLYIIIWPKYTYLFLSNASFRVNSKLSIVAIQYRLKVPKIGWSWAMSYANLYGAHFATVHLWLKYLPQSKWKKNVRVYFKSNVQPKLIILIKRATFSLSQHTHTHMFKDWAYNNASLLLKYLMQNAWMKEWAKFIDSGETCQFECIAIAVVAWQKRTSNFHLLPYQTLAPINT